MLRDKPAFAEPLHVGRPNLGDPAELQSRISGIVERRWLTNDGPLVQEFERKLGERLEVPHCVAMCNATIALEIAIRAAPLRGEVIVPSYTFVATAHALQWQGLKPVFCDIDSRTHNIDPARVEALITPRTTGVIGVHLWGNPCDIDSLQAICDRHGLTLMFDAAHAFGCEYRGRPLGGFGKAEVFSFHGTKFMNSGEGGCVTTHDGELAHRMRMMRNFGFAGFDHVVHVGTNGKMPELSAALGLTNLASVSAFVDSNRRNYLAYRDGISKIPGLSLFPYDAQRPHNFQYIVVEVDPAAAGLSRDQFIQVLYHHNVRARRYFYPGCHRMEPYVTLEPNLAERLPRTEEVARRVMLLPTGTTLGAAQIATIVEILADAQRRAEELRACLPADVPPGQLNPLTA